MKKKKKFERGFLIIFYKFLNNNKNLFYYNKNLFIQLIFKLNFF